MLLAHVIKEVVGRAEGQEAVRAVAPSGQMDLPLMYIGPVLGRELLVAMATLGGNVTLRRLPVKMKLSQQDFQTFKDERSYFLGFPDLI